MKILTTALVLLATVFTTAACHKKSDTPAETVKQGDEKLAQKDALEQDMAQEKYSIHLAAFKLADDFNWRRFSKNERAEIKEKLAHFVALSSDVLAIDAKRGYYVTHVDQVVGKRDAATAYQKSIENFEKMVGENFEPKLDGSPQPLYQKSVDI